MLASALVAHCIELVHVRDLGEHTAGLVDVARALGIPVVLGLNRRSLRWLEEGGAEADRSLRGVDACVATSQGAYEAWGRMAPGLERMRVALIEGDDGERYDRLYADVMLGRRAFGRGESPPEREQGF
jgi:hypothetical protein